LIINTAQGGGGSSLEVFNFPISVQTAEPTPIATGHVWVVHDGPVDFNNIVLDDAVKVDYSNGYLMLIVDDTNNGQDTITQLKKIGSAKVPFTSRRDTNNDTVLPWQVGSLNKGGNIIDIKRKYPRVYSRLNDVLDMETAYVWDGTQWVMVSQKGSYLAVAAYDATIPGFLYNRVGESLLLHSGLPDFSEYYSNCVKFSPDGQYVFYGLNNGNRLIGYRRYGDSFVKLSGLYQPSTVSDISFSPDSNFLAVAGNFGLSVYKKQADGTYSPLTNLRSDSNHSYYGCDWSPDGNYVILTGTVSPYMWRFKRTGDTFVNLANPSTLPTDDCFRVKYSPDGQFVAARTNAGNHLCLYHIVSDTQWDYVSNSDTNVYPVPVVSNIVFAPSGYLITNSSGSIFFFTYSATGLILVKQLSMSTSYMQSVAMSIDGTKLAVCFSTSPYLRWYALNDTILTELSAPDTLPTAYIKDLDFMN